MLKRNYHLINLVKKGLFSVYLVFLHKYPMTCSLNLLITQVLFSALGGFYIKPYRLRFSEVVKNLANLSYILALGLVFILTAINKNVPNTIEFMLSEEKQNANIIIGWLVIGCLLIFNILHLILMGQGVIFWYLNLKQKRKTTSKQERSSRLYYYEQ